MTTAQVITSGRRWTDKLDSNWILAWWQPHRVITSGRWWTDQKKKKRKKEKKKSKQYKQQQWRHFFTLLYITPSSRCSYLDTGTAFLERPRTHWWDCQNSVPAWWLPRRQKWLRPVHGTLRQVGLETGVSGVCHKLHTAPRPLSSHTAAARAWHWHDNLTDRRKGEQMGRRRHTTHNLSYNDTTGKHKQVERCADSSRRGWEHH